MKTECLTEVEVAAYVDGMADTDARERVESHIVTCPLCLHHVAELKQLAGAYETSPVSTPGTALARALHIIGNRTRSSSELSIVAVLRDGLVKILETTGSLLPPPRLAPVPVRTKKQPVLIPRVAKSIGGYFVTVELSREGGTFVADVSLLEEETSERPDGVKVKLLAGDASETRYSKSGKVRFATLGTGVANLYIEGIGRVKLEFR